MDKKKNPYNLISYSSTMSKKQIDKNNKNHWDWEIKYNDFVPANANLQKLEEYKKTITI